ncbi:MAG TPA: nuclear transport factor 2 family protein [Thermoleophilaceae bacterium]
MEALVRELIDATIRRDFGALEGGMLHPDFEYESLFAQAEGEVWRGVNGLRRWAEEVDTIWEDFRVTVEGIEVVDDDTAVLCARLTGRARGSGVPLDQQIGQVWIRRDGMVERVVAHPTLEDARAAARAQSGGRAPGG